MLFVACEKSNERYNVLVQASNIENACNDFKDVYEVHPARIECINDTQNTFVGVGITPEKETE